MPIDVSTPDWACVVCQTRFGQNRAAAERCESAPAPEVLPDGELVLDHQDAGYHTAGGFRLLPLFGRDDIGTLATAYNTDRGHVARYWIGPEPPRVTGEGRRVGDRSCDAAQLWPHQPGQLNILRFTPAHHPFPRGAFRAGWGAGAAAWPLHALGLPVYEQQFQWAPGRRHGAALVRPLTPQIRAVFDWLGARLEVLRLRDGSLSYDTRQPAATLALEATGNLPRARWWLATMDPAELIAAANGRLTRWFAGEDTTAPSPRLSARRRTSASKLTRDEQALVAATGVAWPPRTSSAEYLALLVRTLLEVAVPATERLFNVSSVTAVHGTKGGVGKSFTAAALATRLAMDGRRTVLVDLDLPDPSQHLLWGLGPAETDVARRLVRPSPTRVPGLAVFSHGQLASDVTALRWDAEQTAQWLDFLGATLDLDGVDAVVLDLPPGYGPVHQLAFDKYLLPTSHVVHVTSGHELAIAGTRQGLTNRDMHDTAQHWVVENLSRVRVTTADGSQVEGHLYGGTDAVRTLAEQTRARYVGSLRWEPDPVLLASTAEIGRLAAAVAADRIASGASA